MDKLPYLYPSMANLASRRIHSSNQFAWQAHQMYVNVHLVTDNFHLVDQVDINSTVYVFQQFGHFCSTSTADRYDFINDLAVKGKTYFHASRLYAPADLIFRNFKGGQPQLKNCLATHLCFTC